MKRAEEGTASTTAMASMALMTGGSFLVRVLEIAGMVVLARLLTPEDFGAVGLALVVVNVVNLFTQAGIGSAIIQTDVAPRRAAANAFVVIAALGVSLTLVAALLVGPVTRALGHPELDMVLLAVLGLVPIQAAAVVPTSLLIRDLQFGRQVVTQLLAAVVRLVVGITAAMTGFGLWSLVLGHLAGAAANTLASIVLNTQRGWLRPSLLDRELAGELARFGSPLMATGLIRQVYNNADDLVVGAAFGTAALGFYRHAYRLANLPVDGITHAVNTVLLPSYSRLKGTPARLGREFVGALRVLAAVSLPMAAGLWVFSEPGVVIALGEQWRPVAPLLRILAVVAIVRPLSGATGPLFTAVGKPGLNLRTALLQATALPLFVLLLYRGGTSGVAVAVAGTFLLGLLHNLALAVRDTGAGVRPRQLVASLLPSLASAAAMVAVVLGVRSLLPAGIDPESPWVVLALGLVALAVYGVALRVADRPTTTRIARLVRDRLGHGGAPAGVPSEALAPASTYGPPLGAWAAAHLGEPAVPDRIHHVSGWKRGGAFRLEGTTASGRAWTLVWKEARYDDADLPALAGLPVRPGPPEYTVYVGAGPALRPLLPEVHHAAEVERGRHYQYLLEDLAPTHVRARHPALARDAAALVHRVQRAMHTDLSGLGEGLLDYGPDFMASVPGYAFEGLRMLAAGDHAPDDLQAPGSTDEAVVRRRCERARVLVEARVPLGPVHGDLNPTNVWADPYGDDVRVVDWEWAGIGLPHLDLVSALKRAPADLEGAAVLRFHALQGESTLADDVVAYRWCRLQRYLLDAGFFARQLAGASVSSGRLDLGTHVRRSLALVRESSQLLARSLDEARRAG